MFKMRWACRLAGIFAVTLILVGCSSLHGKAEKHFKNGEYLAAASLYKQILDKNAHDPVALERLEISRQHVIEDRLIQVRQQRLSDNYVEALNLLLAIWTDEAQWKISPTGVAFSTQTEEVDLLFQWLNRQARQDLQGGKFLKTKVFVDSYSPLFTSGQLRQKYEILESAILDKGRVHCETLKKLGNGPFGAEFLNRYCMVWGQSDSHKVLPLGAATAIAGYGQIKFVGKFEALPDGVVASLADSLLDALKTTPYFRAAGPPLEVELSGKFVSTYVEKPFLAVHNYEVQIPYQEMITVPYSESEPYTELKTVTDPLTGASHLEPHTEFRQVTKHRPEWITRYRSEPRAQPYPATEFELSYVLDGRINFTLDRSKFELPVNEQLSVRDTFHDMENRQIGLVAKPKKVPSAVPWLQEKFATTGSKLSVRIAQDWDAKYCQVPANLSERTQIEVVMKCLKGTRTGHDFVENWFQNKFGLSYEQVKKAIGFGA